VDFFTGKSDVLEMVADDYDDIDDDDDDDDDEDEDAVCTDLCLPALTLIGFFNLGVRRRRTDASASDF